MTGIKSIDLASYLLIIIPKSSVIQSLNLVISMNFYGDLDYKKGLM
jgi:hypothetical protein